MYRKIRRACCCLLLLAVLLGFSGCSGEELLSQTPQTLQVGEQKAPKKLNTVEEAAKETTVVEEQTEEPKEEAQPVCFLSEQVYDYAYQSLTPQMQIWYRDIEQALGTMAESVRLSEEGLQAGLSEECIDIIFQCVLIDHPEIFYVDGYTYTSYSRGDTVVGIEFCGNYFLTPQEALPRKEEIELALASALEGIDSTASDYDKIKYVYDLIVKNTDYNLEAPDNQNIYSVFVGHSSVCLGYAKAVQYLLNALEVDCTLVQGSVYNGEGHAWNLVRAEGSFYYVDATWGDASYQPRAGEPADELFMPEINYDYLCVTTEQLLRSHTLDSCVPMPECVATAANYYVREGALFTEYNTEQLTELFARAMESGQPDVTVKCADMDCYYAMRTSLIDEQKIFNFLTQNQGTISYSYDEEQLSLTFWVTNE